MLLRLEIPLSLDPRRVLMRPYGNPDSPQGKHMIERVLARPKAS